MFDYSLVALLMISFAIILAQHRKIATHKCRADEAMQQRTDEVRDAMMASVLEATQIADRVAEKMSSPCECSPAPECKHHCKSLVCRIKRWYARRK